MKEIVVVGEPEFTLGFRLAGIRKVLDAEKIPQLLDDKSIGIVILNQQTMDNLDERIREEVVASISPVFVVVAETAEQGELRKMIIQSIGVDLLKEE